MVSLSSLGLRRALPSSFPIVGPVSCNSLPVKVRSELIFFSEIVLVLQMLEVCFVVRVISLLDQEHCEVRFKKSSLVLFYEMLTRETMDTVDFLQTSIRLTPLEKPT